MFIVIFKLLNLTKKKKIEQEEDQCECDRFLDFDKKTDPLSQEIQFENARHFAESVSSREFPGMSLTVSTGKAHSR